MTARDWGRFTLHEGDCVEVMRTMAAESVDSVVTDPPYELGFMGKAWDRSGVAMQPATWREALRVLKPGGYLLAFSGTRTYHRMVCAIEDAGFEIRDQIGWAFGSGFPKSHNGHWGGTALKPAWEPICLARKPLIGTVEANWREHGTGALNIDGCRVSVDPTADASQLRSMHRSVRAESDGWGMSTVAGDSPQVVRPDGRWPANLIHDGSAEVLATFPQAGGARAPVLGAEPSAKTANTFGAFAGRAPSDQRDGGGSAARFFYCAKASKSDRSAANNHPTVKPTDLMRYLCRLVTPAGGLVLDPFTGSGSTGKAAMLEGFRFVGIEMDPAYCDIAERRIADAWMPGVFGAAA